MGRTLTAVLLAALVLTVAGLLVAQQQAPLFPTNTGPVQAGPNPNAPAQPGTVQPGTPQAQPGTQPAQPGDDIFKLPSVSVRNVIAPTTVTDRSGRVVNTLTSLDFQLYDNNKLQKIAEDQATHPISLVVAIEASAEVEKILPQVQKVGPLLSSLLIGDSGEVAILSFDHATAFL